MKNYPPLGTISRTKMFTGGQDMQEIKVREAGSYEEV